MRPLQRRALTGCDRPEASPSNGAAPPSGLQERHRPPDRADMESIRRFRGSRLLARFAVISAALTIAVGLVVAQVLSAAIAQRAREQAEWTATVTLRLGVQSQLSRTDLANGFD